MYEFWSELSSPIRTWSIISQCPLSMHLMLPTWYLCASIFDRESFVRNLNIWHGLDSCLSNMTCQLHCKARVWAKDWVDNIFRFSPGLSSPPLQGWIPSPCSGCYLQPRGICPQLISASDEPSTGASRLIRNEKKKQVEFLWIEWILDKAGSLTHVITCDKSHINMWLFHRTLN